MFFFFNDTATTEIYTLSLHDALPIWRRRGGLRDGHLGRDRAPHRHVRHTPTRPAPADRKSTRLNSSHANISYAVFCLKKKKIHRFASYIPYNQIYLHTSRCSLLLQLD